MPARKSKRKAKEEAKKETNNANEKQEDKLLFNALLVILAIIVVFFVYSLSIGRAPQAYTQVWLASDNPSGIKAGQGFNAGFVIENDEGKQVEYSYSISAEGMQKASGKVNLESGKQRLIGEKISFSKPSTEKQKVLIEVTKAGRSEPYTLWFWLAVGEK